MWPDRELIEKLGLELPIIQAPMAGANGVEMAVAVSKAGGLGSLPCAMIDSEQFRDQMQEFRQQTDKPINVNFFCHTPPSPDPQGQANWKLHLDRYYKEFGLSSDDPVPAVNRAPFDEAMCEIVEETRPQVVSFHFGLPERSLLDCVNAAGSFVIASATTVKEAIWLEKNGADAVIAQGNEAGGHRGMFLTEDIQAQPGLFALLPQIADAIDLPVIAAGGIADGRGVAASFALGASLAQIGTAYLFTPEAMITDMHRAALDNATADGTTLTNLFSGRPARSLYNRVIREIGPISEKAPAFPTAGGALAPLKTASESNGSGDFSSLWSGQSASLAKKMGAGELTKKLAEDALERMRRFQT